MRALESLVPEENASLVADKQAQQYPCFVEMLAYLSSPHVAATRARLSAPVKSAMVTFCGACLAESAQAEGGATRAQYLDAGRADRTDAATRLHELIGDALVSSLSSGARKSVNDTALSKSCFVALIDLFGARRCVSLTPHLTQ